MEALIYLDTHVAAWLYAGRVDLLTPRAIQLVDEDDLFLSPAVVLELEYLHEIGRLTVGGNTIVQGLSSQLGVTLCDAAFTAVVEGALDHDWTRNPFDRLIVAQAALSGSALLTKDRTILRHYRKATW